MGIFRLIYKNCLVNQSIRKLTGGLGMMGSLVSKVCSVLCVKSGPIYQRENMCTKYGSRLRTSKTWKKDIKKLNKYENS